VDNRYQALVNELIAALNERPGKRCFEPAQREELQQVAKEIWDGGSGRVDAQVIHLWLRGRFQEDPKAKELTDDDDELIKAVALTTRAMASRNEDERIQYMQQALLVVRRIRHVPGAEVLNTRLAHTLGPRGKLP